MDVLFCKDFSQFPSIRAGGTVYLVRGREDGGVGNYLATKGFNVCDTVVDGGRYDDYAGLSVRTPPDGTRLVVGVGDFAVLEAAKLIASLHDLPLWCVPLSYDGVNALADYTLWTVDRAPAFLPVSRQTVLATEGLLVPTRDGVQQIYQHLFAYYVSLQISVYANRLFLREADNERLSPLLATVQTALLSVGEYNPAVAPQLWSTICAVAPVCSDREIMLYAKAICVYKKSNMSYNRYIFAAAYAYLAALTECADAPDLLLPPDRTAVAEAAKGLGWNIRPAPSPDRAERRRLDWAWRDYLADVRSSADVARQAAKCWRRLVGSAGYGFFEDLSPSDLTYLMPVVAETSPTYTPFKHLYLRGGFDLFN